MSGDELFNMKSLMKKARTKIKEATSDLDEDLDHWRGIIQELVGHLQAQGHLQTETQNYIRRVNQVCKFKIANKIKRIKKSSFTVLILDR